MLSFDLIAKVSCIYANFVACMKKYSVEVLEVLSHIVEVEASDDEDAIERVKQMYRKCEIVLDDSDYKVTEFSVKDEKSG